MKENESNAVKRILSVLVVLSMALTSMVVIVGTMPSNVSATTYTDFTIGAASSNMTVTNGSTWVSVNTEEYQIYVNWSGLGAASVVTYYIRPYFTTNEIFFRRGLNLAADGNATYNASYVLGGTTGGLDSIGTVINNWGQSGTKISFNESCDTPVRYYINSTFTIYRDYMEMNVTYVPGTDTIVTNYAMCLANSAGTVITAKKYMPGYIDNPPSSGNTGGWYSTRLFAPVTDFRDTTNMGIEWGYNDTACYIRFPYNTPAGLMGGGGSNALNLRYCHSNSIMADVWNASGQTFHTFLRPYQFNDGQVCGHCVAYAQWIAPLIANWWGNHGHDDVSFPMFQMDLAQWNHTQPFGQFVEQNSSIKVATYTLNTSQVDWNYKAAFAPNIDGDDTLTAVNASWWATYPNGTAYHGVPWSGNASLVVKCNPTDGDWQMNGSFLWNLIANDTDQAWWNSSGGIYYDMADSVDAYGQAINDYSNHSGNFLTGLLELIKDSWEAAATPEYNWSWVFVNTGYGANLHVAMAASRDCLEGLVPTVGWTIDERNTIMSIDLFLQNMPAAYRPRILCYQYYTFNHPENYQALYDGIRMSIQYHFDLAPMNDMNNFSSKLPMTMAMNEFYCALGGSFDHPTTITPGWVNVTTNPISTVDENFVVLYAGEGVTPTITFNLPPHSIYNVSNLNHTARNLELVLPLNSEYYVVGDDITSPTMTFFDTGDSQFNGTIAADVCGSIVPYSYIDVVQYGTGQATVSLVNNSPAASTLTITGTAGQYTNISIGNMTPARVYGVYMDGVWMQNQIADVGGIVYTSYMYNSTHTLLVGDPLGFSATITSNVTTGMKPLNVTFNSTVSAGGVPPYTYWWNFGDGNTSNSANTTHEYPNAGVYAVQLTVNDSDVTSEVSNIINIDVLNTLPLAVTISSDVVGGSRPLNVTFNSTVNGGTPPYTYFWTFGDGNSSALANVSYIYNVTGTYSARLLVNDSLAASVTSNLISISVINTGGGGGPYEKQFVASYSYETNGLVVTFADKSYSLNYPITNWFWNFGDGIASESQNPTHTYDIPGTYQVQLWVNNTVGGTKTIIKEVTVSNLPPIIPADVWAKITGPYVTVLIIGAVMLLGGIAAARASKLGILLLVLGVLVLFVWWLITFGINL
jgi:PKD repeat protein